MRTIILVIFSLSFIVFGCSPNSKKIVWSDEFDYSGQPDSTFWNYELGDGCPGLCGWGNNEEQAYTNSTNNVRIEDGKLIIEAIKLDSQWTSARITTRTKMNFTYGRIEFRAKLPKGVGTWPALWMLSERIATEGWPACGEIDVMEHVGRNPGVVQSALHSKSNFGGDANVGETEVDSFNREFHIYGANWTKDKIEFFVDDEIFHTYEPSIKTKETWPFKDPFYMIMNIAIGGGLGGPVDKELKSARMEVDYVRVYE